MKQSPNSAAPATSSESIRTMLVNIPNGTAQPIPVPDNAKTWNTIKAGDYQLAQETFPSDHISQAHFKAADGSLQVEIIPGVVLLQHASYAFPHQVHGVRKATFGLMVRPGDLVNYQTEGESVIMTNCNDTTKSNQFSFLTLPSDQTKINGNFGTPNALQHTPENHAETSLYGKAFDLVQHNKTSHSPDFSYLQGTAQFPSQIDSNSVHPTLLPEAGAQVLVSAMRSRFPNLVPLLSGISDYTFPQTTIYPKEPIAVTIAIAKPEINEKKGGTIVTRMMFKQRNQLLASLQLSGTAISQRAFKRGLGSN